MATIARTGKLLTAEEFMALGDDGHAELVDGEVIMTSLAAGDHGEFSVLMSTRLVAWAYPRRLGRVFDGQTAFVLRRGADTVRSPDVAFVSTARLPAVRRGALEVGPDLAVEVLSPSDRLRAVLRKLQDYFAAGTRLVWLVDLEAREIGVVTPERPMPHWLGTADALDGADVLPGLTIPIGELFGALDSPPAE